MMNEVLTRDEMKTRFQNEWLLIADPEVDEQFEILSGNVVCHSKERDDIDQMALQLRLKASATLYTGEFPDDAIYLL